MLAHPELWPTALRQAARLAPAGWWRRPPFLPLPDREYLRFRLETQYGSPTPAAGAASVTEGGAGYPGAGRARPWSGRERLRLDPEDVVTYLRWCRDQERARRTGARARAGNCAGPRRPRR
ncbi:MAG TPA: hypothetical protein VFC99_10725 [Acidimicrobiia bacterium]|nr:hypothetical protein [Acidimicrobiia bacterium]